MLIYQSFFFVQLALSVWKFLQPTQASNEQSIITNNVSYGSSQLEIDASVQNLNDKYHTPTLNLISRF